MECSATGSQVQSSCTCISCNDYFVIFIFRIDEFTNTCDGVGIVYFRGYYGGNGDRGIDYECSFADGGGGGMRQVEEEIVDAEREVRRFGVFGSGRWFLGIVQMVHCHAWFIEVHSTGGSWSHASLVSHGSIINASTFKKSCISELH